MNVQHFYILKATSPLKNSKGQAEQQDRARVKQKSVFFYIEKKS